MHVPLLLSRKPTQQPVASALSPTVVNFLANEYNDANCTDSTGNTVIISGDNIAGHTSGNCSAPDEGGRYAMGECRTDGSYISQSFSPEDDTCSGDVWGETTGPTEFSPPVCISTAVNGLYYGYISCTTEASTLLLGGTPAPTTAPTETNTINTATDTPAPSTIANGDDVTENTPAPVADDGSRGVSVTVPPSPAVSGSEEVGETTSPIGTDEASQSNGAATGIGSGSGVFAMGFATLLSCVVGLWVFIEM